MAELKTGTVLTGTYRLDEKLGEGGMAVVYKAYDVARLTWVAIKALKPDFAEDDTFLRKFRREARSLQRLQHPNIVRLFDFVEDGLQAAMVLEYIDGQTLRAMARQLRRPLTPGEALGYLRPICSALSYAHRERVVHCDIKPANVMIDHAGRVVVNDFGIARLSESATVTFSAAGTAQYMAPEQWRGGEDVYPATDVYALGVMLLELLTGAPVFRGETAPTRGSNRERIMWEHLHAAPPAVHVLNPAVPAIFDPVLARCLAKEPQERYASADALLAAFEEACRITGLSAVPVLPLQAPESLPTGETLAPPASAPHAPSPSAGRTQFVVPALIGGGLLVAVIALVPLGLIQTPWSLGLAPTATVATTETPVPAPTVTSPASIPTLEPTITAPPATPTVAIAGWQQGQLIMSLQTPGGSALYVRDLELDAAPSLVVGATGQKLIGADLSPDGLQVAYEVFKKQLYVMELGAEQDPRPLGECGAPSWSPDGAQLICHITTPRRAFRIWDAQTGQLINEIRAAGGAVNPMWSPDGREIAYAEFTDGGTRLWRVAIDGLTAPILIATTGSENYAQAWSPDGQWIAYQSNAGSTNSEIWIMRPDGREPRPLTTTPNGWSRAPSWSPDGRWLAFVSSQAGSLGADLGEAFAISVEDGELIQLTDTGGAVYDWRVSWGP